MSGDIRRDLAQVAISRAMKLWRTESYVEQPAEAVKFNRYQELTRDQLDQGVKALVAHCNLSGGSMGDMDLYKLVRTYLWDEEARAAINVIVK